MMIKDILFVMHNGNDDDAGGGGGEEALINLKVE